MRGRGDVGEDIAENVEFLGGRCYSYHIMCLPRVKLVELVMRRCKTPKRFPFLKVKSLAAHVAAGDLRVQTASDSAYEVHQSDGWI